jgi:hypothetical protein
MAGNPYSGKDQVIPILAKISQRRERERERERLASVGPYVWSVFFNFGW